MAENDLVVTDALFVGGLSSYRYNASDRFPAGVSYSAWFGLGVDEPPVRIKMKVEDFDALSTLGRIGVPVRIEYRRFPAGRGQYDRTLQSIEVHAKGDKAAA